MAAPIFTCKSEKCFFRTSNFSDSSNKHLNVVNKLIYSDMVSLIVPSSVKTSDILQTDQHPVYYIVRGLPLLKLIHIEFIQAFVQRGDMYMLSQSCHAASDFCCALRPPGILELEVTKDVYEELGLEGHPVEMNAKMKRLNQNVRYVIIIDLTDKKFKPGKKWYERVKWCFSNRLGLVADFYTTWTPKDDTICSSSIGAYFSCCGFETTQGVFKTKCRHKRVMTTPIIAFSSPEETDENCSSEEFYEWLGMVACNCVLEGDQDQFTSSYITPTSAVSTSSTHIELRGFLTPSSIHDIITQLRHLMESASFPWTAMTVHGMQRPTCLNEDIDGNRNPMYILVLFNNNDYWLYSTTNPA